MKSFILQRLKKKEILERIFLERLTEPLHLNFLSLFVALFGNTRQKIKFDLLVRQQHAFCLLNAADNAVREGKKRATVVEFGVANGAGLLNICRISKLITATTGIEFDIYGFDTGRGMPPPRDYRDHPEHYFTGDFPMNDPEKLKDLLPENARLIIGDIQDTLPAFIEKWRMDSPLGFVSIDVDYYYSTVDCLSIFDVHHSHLQRCVSVYLDDIAFESHNSWCGELNAVREFNLTHDFRKIEPYNHLHTKRLFKNAKWIDHIFTLHVLDHQGRQAAGVAANQRILDNPYL